MKKFKALSALLCALLLLLVSGCNNSSGTAGDSAADSTAAPSSDASTEAPSSEAPSDTATGGRVFGATYMSMNNEHFQAVNNGIKAALEANGDELITLDPDFDPNKQLQQLEDFIEQKIDGLFISPVDGNAIMPGLEAIRDAGIPIVVVDANPADPDVVNCIVSADNYDAGYQAGLTLCKALNGTGKVGFIDYYIPDATVIARQEGFKKALDENPGIELIVEQTGQGSADSALPIMENILQAEPDINGMFCINDPTAAGAISACEGAGRSDVLISSVDGSPQAIQLIKEGKQLSTSSQNPQNMGTVGVEMMYKLLDKQTVDHYVQIPITLIDKNNVEQY